jgi:hypothetical protein
VPVARTPEMIVIRPELSLWRGCRRNVPVRRTMRGCFFPGLGQRHCGCELWLGSPTTTWRLSGASPESPWIGVTVSGLVVAGIALFWREVLGLIGSLFRKYADEAAELEGRPVVGPPIARWGVARIGLP